MPGPEAALKITLKRDDQDVREALQRHSRTNIMSCLQCKSCSNGCPFFKAMDLGPNRIVRLLQLGRFEEALTSTTIWICVGCDTCASNCPMSIDIPAVMDVLRQYALDSDRAISMPEVLDLHQEILGSIQRYGRTHKLEIMLRYKVRKKAWLEDWDLGLKMLSRRKLHLLPAKVRNLTEIKDLFSTSRAVSWPGGHDHE